MKGCCPGAIDVASAPDTAICPAIRYAHRAAQRIGAGY
jgi:hypothetical protein